MAFVRDLKPQPDDWLILGGDVSESVADLTQVLESVTAKFAQVFWVPGNHELWSVGPDPLRGEAKYDECVARCRDFGVLTPEDPYAPLPDDPQTYVAPLFVLYDYSFRPPDVPRERALQWAIEGGSVCADEAVLHPAPYPSRDAWCHARVDFTARRLAALPEHANTILVNHFPLRQSHAVLPAIPRFTLWCGTTQTDQWHLRYRARAVVYGHLHLPTSFVEDGVVFHEVSLGYPREKWRRGPRALRHIWPSPDSGLEFFHFGRSTVSGP